MAIAPDRSNVRNPILQPQRRQTCSLRDALVAAMTILPLCNLARVTLLSTPQPTTLREAEILSHQPQSETPKE